MFPDTGVQDNRQAVRALSRLTFRLAIPLALQNLVAFAVNMADTLMLGQLGEIPLSASAQANQLFFIVTLAVGGVVGGANVFVAQAWGRRDVDAIHRVLAYAYRVAMAVAVLSTVAAVAFPTAVMGLFSTDAAVIGEGAVYLRVVGLSYLFYTLTTVTTGALQAVHTVRISMLASAAAMAINVGLNALLIFGLLGFPKLGILGAAIATLIARVCELGIVLFYVYRKEDKLRIRLKKLLPLDKSLAKPFFSTSLPVIANELFWALGEAALAVLMGRMGTEMVAANSICAVASQFASVFCRGVTAAACVIVANTVGAEKSEDIPIQKRYFQRLAVVLGLLAGLAMIVVRPFMLRLYNVDVTTLGYAGQIMLVEAGIQVFRYFQLMNMMGILRGGGDVRFAMVNDLVFLWGFTVPAGFLAGLVLHWPVPLVYFIIKFDQIIKTVTSEVRLRRGKWIHNTGMLGVEKGENMAQRDFAARLIAPATWLVSGAGCDCYLLEGEEEALMIDAGCSRANIRAFAQSLTEKPVHRVVNTHSHFDHTGGNGYFDQVLITEAASRSAKTVMDDLPEYFPLDYDFTFLEDGQSMGLGGRRLRIVELSCHSPGSIAILDESRRLLFCGDEVDSGQVLLLPGYAERAGEVHAAPAATVEACRRSMEKMKGLGGFDVLCTGHNGAPIAPIYLDWFIKLCDDILEGKEGEPDCSSRSYSPEKSHYPLPNAGYLRRSYKGASLVYNRHLLQASDIPRAKNLPPATPLHLMSGYMSYDAVTQRRINP